MSMYKLQLKEVAQSSPLPAPRFAIKKKQSFANHENYPMLFDHINSTTSVTKRNPVVALTTSPTKIEKRHSSFVQGIKNSKDLYADGND